MCRAIIGAAVGLAYRIVAYKYGKGGKDVNYYNFYMSLWAYASPPLPSRPLLSRLSPVSRRTKHNTD